MDKLSTWKCFSPFLWALSCQRVKAYITHDIYNKGRSLSTYLPHSPVFFLSNSPPCPLPHALLSTSNLTHWHLISWWVEDASPHQPCSVADLFRLGHSSAISAPPPPPTNTPTSQTHSTHPPTLSSLSRHSLATSKEYSSVLLKWASWWSGNWQ